VSSRVAKKQIYPSDSFQIDVLVSYLIQCVHFMLRLKLILFNTISINKKKDCSLTDDCSSTSEQDEQAESVGKFVQAKQIDENDRGERNVAGWKINLY
jgi:hypothetical protein